jgi:hypothetical protein
LLLVEASQLRGQRRRHATLRQRSERIDTNIAGRAVMGADLRVHDAALVGMEIDTRAVGGGSKADH